MAAAEQRDPYAHLEDNDAPPPTAEELAAVKDAIESGTAVLNMSPSKKKPNITMEELVGLPKGSQIPKGTMDAINQAWQRGNYVRSSTKKVTGVQMITRSSCLMLYDVQGSAASSSMLPLATTIAGTLGL